MPISMPSMVTLRLDWLGRLLSPAAHETVIGLPGWTSISFPNSTDRELPVEEIRLVGSDSPLTVRPLILSAGLVASVVREAISKRVIFIACDADI